MSGHGISREDVRAWPNDSEAAAELADYLEDLNASVGEVAKVLSGEMMDFRGADLSHLMLDEAFLFNADLSDVRLVGASLGRANLGGAILRRSDLTSADLTKAELVECDAQHATFTGATLFSVDFSDADLRSVDLRDAIVNSTSFFQTRLDGADLRNASLRFCHFGHQEAAATIMTGASIANCAFDEAGGFVVGPVDIGDDETDLLEGAALASWFHAHGAPAIKVVAGR
ncbi:pentapeptide repeat-containing protein [Spirillospora sp. NPDC047279]|uniref:pentapeptide repeat-containing protein n=1 Tax=Spirillospora sp. NPDC047279 TaxID=3155478 RepID=UPI003410EFB2